jgi:three-Cys-motif partner protein
MKVKWDNRFYLDLFSGPGWSRILETSEVVPASPILATLVSDPFDKYIFCDNDQERCETLRERLDRDQPSAAAECLNIDVNKQPETVLNEIPPHGRGATQLSFCFVDPFGISDLHFSTIETLSSQKFMDFLVLVASYMDANRNLKNYINDDSNTIELFLGMHDWRDRWYEYETELKNPGERFGTFVADQFCQQMRNLGFIYNNLADTELIRNPKNNTPLYRLAFFSKHPRGMEFWNKARDGVSKQLKLL